MNIKKEEEDENKNLKMEELYLSSEKERGGEEEEKKRKKKRKKIGIVGAGMAGLSLGRILMQRGYDVTLLEGQDRVGGRVWTEKVGDYHVDLGASVVMGLEGNPLTPLFRQLRVRMYPLRAECKLHTAAGERVPRDAGRETDCVCGNYLTRGFWKLFWIPLFSTTALRHDEVDCLWFL